MTKINKTQAKKAYNSGKKIKILPCKMNPENLWQKPIEISINDPEIIEDIKARKSYKETYKKDYPISELTFEKRINNFEIYNCNNETGKYSTFYID